MGFSSALLLFGDRIGESVQQQLLLAMGLLPLLAGIREAYSYKKADKELIKQFRFMTRLFASCRQRLDRAHDDAETRHLAVRDDTGTVIAASTWTPRLFPDDPGEPAMQLRGMAVREPRCSGPTANCGLATR